jgi:hypothetical protein
MAELHVLSALFDKYAEILGQLKQCERQANSHSENLAHIEAVIRLYRPEWTADGVKARKPHKPLRWPSRGVGMRTALSILKASPEPLTTREIVVRVLDRLNMQEPDYDDLKLICSSFNSALRNKAARGGVTMVEGRPVRWAIVQQQTADQ